MLFSDFIENSQYKIEKVLLPSMIVIQTTQFTIPGTFPGFFSAYSTATSGFIYFANTFNVAQMSTNDLSVLNTVMTDYQVVALTIDPAGENIYYLGYDTEEVGVGNIQIVTPANFNYLIMALVLIISVCGCVTIAIFCRKKICTKQQVVQQPTLSINSTNGTSTRETEPLLKKTNKTTTQKKKQMVNEISTVENEARNNKHFCTICATNKANAIVTVCGHYGMCMNCGLKLNLCPFCRVKYSQEQLLKVFEME